MADKSLKSFHDMPWLARVISGVMGAFFVTGGLCFGLAWFSVGDWQLIVGMIFIVGLGADLLQGGIRGRWPMSIPLWLLH